MESVNHFEEFAAIMRGAGVKEAPILAFRHSYERLLAGDAGTIAEETIEPIDHLPGFEAVVKTITPDPRLLSETVILKLNGGLGTSMGLAGPKSLLAVKSGLTFLDLIARNILYLRSQFGQEVRLMLMNSFSTSLATAAFLRKYPELGAPDSLELLQSQVPKVEVSSFRPVRWPANPQLEWCPPGHGDIYPSLLGSGWLDRLLNSGVKYMFVANADNLGASMEPGLLSYFANSEIPFLMEVAERTAADRKGGHLARRNGRFLLRESAQCAEKDEAAFQDIRRHRFFNTNNLWIRLDRLKELVRASGGYVALPLIRNKKTVDPRVKTSPAVYQLETAMGAAIESFDGAGAVVVPRTRFAPVKTTADLLALRSDAYEVTPDWRVVLAGQTQKPPVVSLDAKFFGLVDQLEASLARGVPSLRQCEELSVLGSVRFSSENVFAGKVKIVNEAADPRELAAGAYKDTTIRL